MKAGYINGAQVGGTGAVHSVQNPSSEAEIARFEGLSPDQIRSAISAARQAYDSGVWSGRPATERADILRRFAIALQARKDQLVDITVKEAGCPRHSMVVNSQVGVPLGQIPEILDLFLSLPSSEDNPLPLAHRVTPYGTTIQSLRRYTPIGVVSAIASYNFPVLTALWKIIPALITGNTVVLRPSPFTPLSAMILADAADEAGLPPGVLNIAIEPGLEGGRLMTTHPDVDMVAFTGSARVGTLVMAQAADTLKRIQLELGGKSAQIFLPDSVDRANRHRPRRVHLACRPGLRARHPHLRAAGSQGRRAGADGSRLPRKFA